MKVKGLNKKEYILDLGKYIVREDDSKKRSKYHIAARNLLREIFSGYSVLEEVKLPGSRFPSKKSVLFLDFLIPSAMLGVEVHGQQHYEYIPFFHKSKAEFAMSKRRDKIKLEWCEINNINLIELKYSDNIDLWRQQIECR
jgi:hypothetical protein